MHPHALLHRRTRCFAPARCGRRWRPTGSRLASGRAAAARRSAAASRGIRVRVLEGGARERRWRGERDERGPVELQSRVTPRADASAIVPAVTSTQASRRASCGYMASEVPRGRRARAREALPRTRSRGSPPAGTCKRGRPWLKITEGHRRASVHPSKGGRERCGKRDDGRRGERSGEEHGCVRGERKCTLWVLECA